MPVWAIPAAIAGASAITSLIGDHQRRQQQRGIDQAAREAEARNVAKQEEFAKMGVQWKVADAKAAGVHPLYALGAQTSSFAPISVGSTQLHDSGAKFDAIANMGQDVSRAAMAAQPVEQTQIQKLAIQNAQLDIEGKYIDNAIRATQLQKLQSPGSPPGIPIPDAIQGGLSGQGDAIRVQPASPTASQGGRPAQEAGAINSYGYTRDSDTSYGIAPSKDMKERIEDDIIGETLWHIRNRINPPPPDTKSHPIPEHLRRQGYKYWFWNPFKQQFVPSKNP